MSYYLHFRNSSNYGVIFIASITRYARVGGILVPLIKTGMLCCLFTGSKSDMVINCLAKYLFSVLDLIGGEIYS